MTGTHVISLDVPSAGITLQPDVPICQGDLPLDWYQDEFKPYAEEYIALKDRTPECVIPWLDSYIKPAIDHFGDSLLLLAHYYMGGEIVKLVERYGGIVADSYALAMQAKCNPHKKVIVELINKHFPDFRRVINELQRYSTSGDIDSGILANIGELNLNLLISTLREKNFQNMRQWVTSNVDNDPISVYRKIYDKLYDVLEKSSIPPAVLIIADYQYKSAFVADQEINLVACLVELMAECEFV